MICKKIKLYPDRPDVTLTAYLPGDSPMLLSGKPRPAVIVCPGGAYLFCADPEAEPVALKFAAMGYHAFVLRYSVYTAATGTFGTPGEDAPVCENTVYPAAERDLARAILEIRARAEEWCVDTERIAICGFSAGAHVCAMYGATWQDPSLAEHFGCASEALRPAAAILGYGVFDMDLIYNYRPNPKMVEMNRAFNLTIFGKRDPSPAELAALSPCKLPLDKMPPCFLWATSADRMAPVENTTEMATALARAGVPFELHIFECGPHGMSTATQASAASVHDTDENIRKWVDLADAWLLKRMALPLKAEAAGVEFDD